MNPLIVSTLERLKISSKDVEIDVLTSGRQSAAVSVETEPSSLPQENSPISVEIARLAEQLRSNEIALANLQCEFEALCAENSWLKQPPAADPGTQLEPRAPAGDCDSTPQLEQPPPFVLDYRSDESPVKRRLTFAGGGVALFLVGLASGYFAFGTTTLAPRTPVQSQPSSLRVSAQPLPSPRAAATEKVVEPATYAAADSLPKSDPEATPNAVVAKAPAAAPAGTFYKVVRPTKVLSKPHASAPAVAAVKPGMKVKVVAARGEWLQVRSLFGRPPGYIRKDTAVSSAVG